jgi:hypothetical protein
MPVATANRENPGPRNAPREDLVYSLDIRH